MKKKLLSIMLSLCMILTTMAAPAAAAPPKAGPQPGTYGFVDVPAKAWYADAVRYVFAKRLMMGTSAMEFAPSMKTNRAMIVTVLYRLEKEPAASKPPFTDISAGKYYAKAVAWASAESIVAGYGNGKFGPNDPITREQMAAILYRYAKYKGYNLESRADLNKFADVSAISGYAVYAMRWANTQGLITGMDDDTLAPCGNAVRAQVASILMRFCENVIPNSDGAESKVMTRSDKITPPDAESYFENNSKVISKINANDSDTVPTEAEICDNLAERGFQKYPVTAKYSMDGEYYEATAISDSSSSKHPTYQTYYVTAHGYIWTIFVINGAVMANPVSYNVQSGLNVQVIISESDTVTSYDNTTNKFYETIPNESALIVKTVGRIDAKTLEGLTLGGIDEL